MIFVKINATLFLAAFQYLTKNKKIKVVRFRYSCGSFLIQLLFLHEVFPGLQPLEGWQCCSALYYYAFDSKFSGKPILSRLLIQFLKWRKTKQKNYICS